MDDRGLQTGFEAAIAEVGDPWAPSAADETGEPRQGSLFGAPVPGADEAGELDPDRAPRGRGRPPGARNKSTQEWSRWILSRYRSPLVGMAELAQANPFALAKELDCEPIEAVRVQQAAAAALAPYVHQRQPLAVQGEGLGMLTLIVDPGSGGSAASQAVEIRPLEDAEIIEENQPLNDAAAAASEPRDRNE